MKIEQKVKQTISRYKLFNKKEKIIVALSGGKDSSVVAYLLKKFDFNIEAMHINLNMGKHSKESQEAVEKLCNNLDINLHIFYPEKEIGKNMLKIFKENKDKKLNNCVMCGVVKKWILNKKARELKADKIVTGHHLNDNAETFLMNILKGSPELNKGIYPKLKIKNKKFVTRVKPLFFIDEKEIEKYAIKRKLNVIREVCPYRGETYRVEVRNFVKTLSEKQKQNLLKNTLKLNERLRKKENNKIEEMIYCENCGEVSRNKICKMCRLIK